MATFTVTVPDIILIGRNGAHGALAIDWPTVPQNVLDHIASVYFPQYLTDAANSGGKDSTGEERLALANKKLTAMYAGEIRTRGDAKEPLDPVEAQAYRDALELVRKQLLSAPEAKSIPKGTKDRAQWVLDARDNAGGREAREVHDIVVAMLDANPDFYKEAARKVKKQAELASAIEI